MAELEQAKNLARKGDGAGALSAARAALVRDASLVDAHLLIGSLCLMKGDVACAEQAYADGTAAAPEAAALHHARGMMLLEAGKLKPAVAALEKAHQLSGEQNADFAADLAYAYIFARRTDDAERTARTAHRLAPKSFAANYTLGIALLQRGQAADAVTALEAAVTAEPKELSARRKLATALTKAGRHKRALAEYQHVLDNGNAKDPRLHAATAGELLALGRASEAVTAMKRALALAPENARLLELLLHTQREAGDKAGAKRTSHKLKKLRGRK